MAGDVILQADRIRKVFGARGSSLFGQTAPVYAVKDASFSIARGTTLGLIGESGSGKSTLGRCVTRLLEPTSGSVIFKGIPLLEVDRRGMKSLRRGFQTIFQDPYSSLNPRKTVERLIREPLDIHQVGTARQRRDRVVELMGLVGLRPDQAGRYPHAFSGGQRQRIAIARALALEPDLLVLDEPTSALDVSVQAQIVNLLLNLQAELKLTYLFISHNLMLVRHISDTIAIMYKGEIVESGATHALFAGPQHDYTRRLLGSVAEDVPFRK